MNYDEFEIKFAELIDGFVNESSPEDIHRMLLMWNFDNTKTALTSVVENPKTDKGSVLMLYWLMVSGYAKQFADRADVIKTEPKMVFGRF